MKINIAICFYVTVTLIYEVVLSFCTNHLLLATMTVSVFRIRFILGTGNHPWKQQCVWKISKKAQKKSLL